MLTFAQQRAVEEAVDQFIAEGGDPATLLTPRVAESPAFGTVLMYGRTLTSDWDDIDPDMDGLVYYSICRSDGKWSPAVIHGDGPSELMAQLVVGVTWADGRPVEITDWPNTVTADSEFDALYGADYAD